MGLGLAHKVFDQTNEMLALSGIFKFSAKNITRWRTCDKAVFCNKKCKVLLYLLLQLAVEINPNNCIWTFRIIML